MKMVPQRLNEDYTRIFKETRQILKNNAWDHISDNMILRYLNGLDWNIERTMKHITNYINFRKELNLTNLTADMLRDMIQLNFMIYKGTRDKCGRPVLFVMLKNFLMQKIEISHL